jgi:hypothetical protein
MEAQSNRTSCSLCGGVASGRHHAERFQILDIAAQPDVIISLRLDPAEVAISNFAFNMLARLKPGVTLAEARADVERMRRLLEALPAGFT